ncbi:MAG: hypothetical protein ACRD29_00325 [Acidimicrobiales bacterium]
MRPWPIVAFAVPAVLILGSCRPDTVRIAFEPEVDATYRYEVQVESVTVTDLLGERRAEVRDEATLDIRQRVLELGDDGVRVEVELRRAGTGTQTFVMRFDRAAQLTEVESVEGIPAEALGRLGLSEIFPAAAGGPPLRPLAPGDEWDIAERVTLPNAEPARLRGEGRLSELGVIDGRDTATVMSETTLPIESTSPVGEGTQRLDGSQTTRSSVTYALADGGVLSAESTTAGEYAVTLLPPDGVGGPPVRGTLTVAVRSEVRRVE